MEEINNLSPQWGQDNVQLAPVVPEITETWDESTSPEWQWQGQEWDNQEQVEWDASTDSQEVVNWEEKFTDSDKNYSELRSKFDSNNNKYKAEIEAHKWELWAYQQYYNDNNKLLEVLNWNPELLNQVNWLIEDEVMTKDEVLQLMSQEAEKNNASKQEEAKYNEALLEWWESRNDVSETVMNTVLDSLKDKDYEWKTIEDTLTMLNWAVDRELLKHYRNVDKEKDKLRTEKLDWVRWNVTPWNVSSTLNTVKETTPFIKRNTSWFSPF